MVGPWALGCAQIGFDPTVALDGAAAAARSRCYPASAAAAAGAAACRWPAAASQVFGLLLLLLHWWVFGSLCDFHHHTLTHKLNSQASCVGRVIQATVGPTLPAQACTAQRQSQTRDTQRRWPKSCDSGITSVAQHITLA